MPSHRPVASASPYAQLTRPMMRGRTGFHADQTWLERPEIGDDAATPQPPANDDVSSRVDAVNLKPVFGEIETDSGNLHGGRLRSLWRSQTTTLWHIDAGSGGRPPHQDIGECHRIRQIFLKPNS